MQILRSRQEIDRERQRVRHEILHQERRLAIVQGDRKGGRPPASFATDSFADAVSKVLLAQPDRCWTPGEVAEVMNEARHRVSATLSRLVTLKPAGTVELSIDNTTSGPGCQNGSMDDLVLHFGCVPDEPIF